MNADPAIRPGQRGRWCVRAPAADARAREAAPASGVVAAIAVAELVRQVLEAGLPW